ncbi:hypothetical protein PFISCL1PPCAC_23664, partial [Pristionchus fissidentatus]
PCLLNPCMAKEYNYLTLKEVKEGVGGPKNFYAVVDEIIDRTDVVVYLRLWDPSENAVVKSFGKCINIIERGDVIRFHRFNRADQGDSYGSIGYGNAGKVMQIVVWRSSGNGEYAMIGKSSDGNFTEYAGELKEVEELHFAWKVIVTRAELGEETNQNQRDDNSDETKQDANNDLEPTESDSFMDDTYVREENDEGEKENGSRFIPMDDAVPETVANRCLKEESDNLDFLLEDSNVEEVVDHRPDPPPLSFEQIRSMKLARRLSDLKSYSYFDTVLQIVDAHEEKIPNPYMVLRCWDPRSMKPNLPKPLRSYPSSSRWKETLRIKAHPAIEISSMNRYVDIYCYDFDKHTAGDGG